MIRQLKYGLRELGTADGRDYEYEDLQKLSELDKKALRERRVINSTIAVKCFRKVLVVTPVFHPPEQRLYFADLIGAQKFQLRCV